MSNVTVEALAAIVSEHKGEEVEASEVTTIPVDPSCITYEVADYWIKAMKAEPKNRNWTPLDREFFVLDSIARNNRKTLDYNLHAEIPEPYRVDSSGETIEPPFLLTKAIKGIPLLKLYTGGNKPDDDEVETYGNRIGIILSRLHAIQSKGAGLLNIEKIGVHPGPWQKYYLGVTSAQWKHIKGSGLVDPGIIDRMAALVEDRVKLMLGEVACILHNDFNPANIIVDPGEKKLGAVVNFSQAGAGSVFLDFAAFFIHCEDERLWKSMLKNYESVRSLPPQFQTKLSYYSFVFAMRLAWFFMQRKDEASKGYFLRRAFEEAAKLDSSFESEASRYSSFRMPSYLS